ncbi:MAG: lytic transglycosylase, partial [Alphaproteobacteria bacterium]|nr:lytic transglycosylase [Alphaproteobacteria bacterium]
MSRILVLLCFVFLSFPASASLSSEVQSWIALRDPVQRYTFSTYSNFLNAHKDWPSSDLIALRAEEALLKPGTANGPMLISWFKNHKPQTDAGRLRYVQALAAQGDSVTASVILVEYWQDGYFGDALQSAVILNFGNWLKAPHHEARLSTRLWQGKLDRAQKTLAY